MKSKKASHIGFVLSFVIFMTSVLFLYTLLVPSLKTDIDKKAAVENLKTELIEEISSDLTSLTVTVVDEDLTETCLQFVNLEGDTGSGKILIQNEEGQTLEPFISSGNVYVDRDDANFDFFKISVSEEFAQANTGTLEGCAELSKGASGYEIGLLKTEKNIFQSQVEQVLVEYGTDYETLKTGLKVPRINEFGLGFVYESGTIVETVNPVVRISVYSQRTPVRYIDEEGNKKSGDLEIRVW